MEKKRLVDLLLISFLFVIGAVFLAQGAVTFNSSGSLINVTGGNITGQGVAASGLDNTTLWTKSGDTEIINFTINFTGPSSISRVNISIPAGYSLLNFNTRNATISMNDKNGLGNGVGMETVNWTITNTSNTVILRTVEGNYSTNGTDTLEIPLSIEFNVTATTGVEGVYSWNVSYTDNETANTDIESTIFYTYIDGIRPRLTEINVTDGTTVLKASQGELNSTKYLKNASVTLYATLTDYNFQENVPIKVYYSSNGSAVNLSSPSYILMSSSNGSAYTYRLNATLPLANGNVSGTGNHSNAFSFMIEVNDTYNHRYIYNATATSGFNFTIDAYNPSVTITPPSLTTINTGDTIAYKCVGTDPESGISSLLWTLTKPNGQTKTYTTESITVASADTQSAGTHTLTCQVKDAALNDVTSTAYEFKAHIKATGTTSSGGGESGGTGASTTETIKVDNSITDVGSTTTVTKQQGQSSTFSLDGKTAHTVKFKAVTSGSVTIEIKSDPIEVTLNVGETKQVDIDADGTNDLEVTLESVSSGAAKITMKKVAQTAAELAAPEPTTPTGEETTTTPTPTEEGEGKTSLAWLWIIIIIIVVIAIVVAVQQKKKK